MNASLYTALLEAQKTAPAIHKDSTNPHFKSKFASLEQVIATCVTHLNDHGIVVIQHPTVLDGQPALRTKLVHAESGQMEEDTMLLLLQKPDPQGQGSGITYARRQALLSALAKAPEDDDGEAASRPQRATQDHVTPEQAVDLLDPNTLRNLRGAYLGLESLVGKKEATDFVAQMLNGIGLTKFEQLSQAQGEACLATLELHRVQVAESVPA